MQMRDRIGCEGTNKLFKDSREKGLPWQKGQRILKAKARTLRKETQKELAVLKGQ